MSGRDACSREFEVAVATAREAGALLLARLGNVRDVRFKSSAVDVVTDADRASEALIAERLLEAFPSDRLLGEEGSAAGANLASERLWIVDPLDGTTNYLHGYPVFAVSIALHVGESTEVGVVYDPTRDELFAARRGHGATLNGEPIATAETSELIAAMLATGFAYDPAWRGENLPYFARFVAEAQAVRRAGSAALDIVSVACGRHDGYWERGIAPWDIAAALLILREAGGVASDYRGAAATPFTRELVAATPALHPRMLAVIAEVAAGQPPVETVDFV